MVFPELLDSGYCVDGEDKLFSHKLDSKAKPLPPFIKLCKKYKSYIIGYVIEKDKGYLYDSAFILSKKRLITKYRKIYLWRNESNRFKRDKYYSVFTLKFGKFSAKVGLQICYEIEFSEWARILSLQGTQILAYPSAFGKARLYT